MRLLLDYGTTRIRASVEREGVLYPVQFSEGRFLGSVVNIYPSGDVEFSSFPIRKPGVISFVGIKQRLLKSALFSSREVDAFLSKTETYFSRRINIRSGFYIVDGELVAGDGPINSYSDDFKTTTLIDIETKEHQNALSFGPLGKDEYKISRYSLKEFKNIVKSKIDFSNLDDIVMGIPVTPGKSYIDLFKESLDKNVRFVYEPLAAVFGASERIEEGNYYVVDFGGGTLDIVVFTYKRGLEKLLGRTQMNFGGVNIDQDLLEYARNRQKPDKQRVFDQRLLPTIRSIKEMLSFEEEVEDFYLDDETNNLISIKINRSEFEEKILKKNFEQLFRNIEDFNETVKGNRIDSALVCGGSCVIPLFQERLRQILRSSLGIEPLFNDDAFLVSKGLSVASKYSIIGDRVSIVDPGVGKTAVLCDVSDLPEKRYFIIHKSSGKGNQVRIDFCSQDISEPLKSFSANLNSDETYAVVSFAENRDISLELENSSLSRIGNSICSVGDDQKGKLVCRINQRTLGINISKTCTFCPQLVDIFFVPTREWELSELNSGKLDPSKLENSEALNYDYSLEFDRDIVYSEDLVSLQILTLILMNIENEVSEMSTYLNRITKISRGGLS